MTAQLNLTRDEEPMAIPYIPDPHNKQLLPLGVDPSTSRPITLDLDLYPHLAIAGWTGGGVTSAMRLIAAHTVATGGTVTIVDPSICSFEALENVPGIDIHTDVDVMSKAITDVHAEMTARFEAGRKGPRRLLAIDGLPLLVRQARLEEYGELATSLRLLKEILHVGRAADCHLVVDIDRTSLRWLGRQPFESATTLLLGKNSRDFVERLGIDSRLQRAYRGAGVLRTPGTDGRQIAVAYLTDEQAAVVASRPQVTG
ncbi:hypothetical protein WKI65_44315 [Streptomyces sp. MS1.AVA.3]|uniref:hypothetical protein n=1 Tax=Streptomyces decoyicus TaxID=249567 RepID=UPI0030C4E0B9